MVCSCTSLVSKFVMLRDQAFLKLQFFAGARAGDLCQIICQGIRRLPGKQGLLIRMCVGKTFDLDHSHSVVIPFCNDSTLCPVSGLYKYFQKANDMGVNISLGYVFRMVNSKGEVLGDPMSYSVVYDRLKLYLTTLGLYAGETPHGVRGGCAITLASSGVASSVTDLMVHMGWRTQGTPDHYARTHVRYSKRLAHHLASSVESQSDKSVRQDFEESDFLSLPMAF